MSYLDGRGLVGISTDTVVDGGSCGKERPDRVFDFEDKIVILECDEDQHKSRPCLCEQTRMVNIGQMFGGMPVYFVRWNPDDYDAVSPVDVRQRQRLLGDFIRDIQEGRTTKPLPKTLTSVIYLYFDGWSGLSAAKWSVLA